ncbi:MAG: DUF3276 family protein [candidate division WOR-3 bacterium]|nr:DUF3276 family protein [candidate division WOR-3 bacterium]
MSEEQEYGEELFSAKVAAGNRTYFVDVQRAQNGAKYLKISESRQGDEKEHEHQRVMVFEEDIVDFIHAITEAMPFMRPDAPPGRLSRLREKHPRAYEKWTEEENARLRAEFAKGTPREELAVMFQRQRAAIKSRLQKFGLLDQSK